MATRLPVGGALAAALTGEAAGRAPPVVGGEAMQVANRERLLDLTLPAALLA